MRVCECVCVWGGIQNGNDSGNIIIKTAASWHEQGQKSVGVVGKQTEIRMSAQAGIEFRAKWLEAIFQLLHFGASQAISAVSIRISLAQSVYLSVSPGCLPQCLPRLLACSSVRLWNLHLMLKFWLFHVSQSDAPQSQSHTSPHFASGPLHNFWFWPGSAVCCLSASHSLAGCDSFC